MRKEEVLHIQQFNTWFQKFPPWKEKNNFELNNNVQVSVW